MEFNEVLQQVLSICPYLVNNQYDGIIVQKLAATNTISETGASHQSHMAFTGKRKDIFPFLAADGYFNVSYDDKDDDLKKYFTLRIPLNIYSENVQLLSRGTDSSIKFETASKIVNASVLRSRRNNAEDQIELSIKSLDDVDFISFRKLLRVDDFFIILKRKKELLYDLIGVPSDISNRDALLQCTDFYKTNGSQTPVDLFSFVENKKETINQDIKHPHNRIIFGAPGTGKSYQLNEDAKVFGDNYERVTFHPNYSYAQFVGTYKPIMKTKNIDSIGDYEKEVIHILSDDNIIPSEKYKRLYQTGINVSSLCALIGLSTGDTDFSTIKADGTVSEKDHTLMSGVGKNMIPYASLKTLDAESEITYSYVPGPFIRVLEKALYSQQIGENEPYLLIIEEINRAVVSAVFGDVFQLLDRNENNESQYEIDVSEDLYNYLTSEDNEETGHKKLNIGKKIKIPSNMFIWATMNSADQGVQPMDAAFKRRWDFEYLPLDKNESLIEKYELPFPKDGAGYQLESWKKIRNTINGLLSKVGNINEDKLLGPFFISENVLKKYNGKTDAKEAKEFADLFKSKVLMYLYEDVCKINPSQVFPKVKSKTGTGKAHFSDVCDEFDKNGIGVFEE